MTGVDAADAISTAAGFLRKVNRDASLGYLGFKANLRINIRDNAGDATSMDNEPLLQYSHRGLYHTPIAA